MNIEELNKMVDHEIQWLSYYSTSESRSKLNEDSNLYLDLITMGYCKTPTPLYLRCSICLLSNDSEINENTDMESIKIKSGIREEYDYTPLEVYLRKFPNEKNNIINRLKPIKSDWKAYESFSSRIPKDHRLLK